MEYQYELIVIGAGPGGYTAAIRAAQLGMKTAVIEKDAVGGTCLNRGCIPTKTLLHAAQLYRDAKEKFETLGLNCGEIGYDIEKIYERKDAVTAQLRGGIEQLLKANKIDFYPGTAMVEDGHHVQVAPRSRLAGRRILIAAGAKPVIPPIPGLQLPGVITSDALLSGKNGMYKSLIIIGGGVIGMEFATIFQSFGCQVTVIEAKERILPTMDREISQNLSMIMKKRGVNIHVSSLVEEIQREKETEELACVFQDKNEEKTVSAQGVLVAIGRTADTTGLFAGGFEINRERGRILVNDRYQTSCESVYAIGDVIPGIQLAHVAEAEGRAAVEAMWSEDMAAAMPAQLNPAAVPGCIYTDPEIAAVGMTSDEAKVQGIPVKTGKFLMSANGKTVIEAMDRGFIKVVFHQETGVLLGAQLMCARATDLIGEFASAIANGLTAHQMAHVIRPHPSFAEAITEAVESTEGRAIHIMPPRK